MTLIDRVADLVLILGHFLGRLLGHHQAIPAPERTDIGQGQGLRQLFLWSGIGISVFGRDRARTRARFCNCVTALISFSPDDRLTDIAVRILLRQYTQEFIPGYCLLAC